MSTKPAAAQFWQDLPDAELHLLDAGHFATETKADEIARFIRDFMPRALERSQ